MSLMIWLSNSPLLLNAPGGTSCELHIRSQLSRAEESEEETHDRRSRRTRSSPPARAASRAPAVRPRDRRRGRAVARRRDDARHRPGHRRAGRDRGRRLAGRRRARRALRARGVRRRALARLWRRSRRSVACARSAALLAERGDVFAELDVLDAGLLRVLLRLHRPVRRRRRSTTTPAGRRSSRARSRPSPAEFAVYAAARADRRRRADHAVERADGRASRFVAAALGGRQLASC